MEAPFFPDPRGVRVSASIGVALHPGDGDGAETLLSRADRAMYAAKRENRGHPVFWEDLAEGE